MAGDEADKKQQAEGGEQRTMELEVASPPEQTQTGVPIQINSRLIDPESQLPGGQDFKEDASKTNYIIIQFTHSPSLDEERQLRDVNVQFCSKISRTSWIAKYEPHDLSPIRNLTFVLYANPYLEKLTLNPTLEVELRTKKRPQGFARRTVTTKSSSSALPSVPENLRNVFIQLHPGSIAPEEMRTFLVTNHGIARERIFLQIHSLWASLTADEILRIAKLDDVSGIHEEPRMTLQNHLVSQVVNTLKARALATQHLGHGLNLDGEDEIIVFADSGFDNGIKDAGLFGFNDKRHPFFKGRILHLDPRSDEKIGGFNRKDKFDDLAGHGTHVAGIALGSFDMGKSQKEINQQGRRLDGVAPNAYLVMQNIIGCPRVDAKGKVISDGGVSLARKDYPYESIFLDPYYSYPETYEGKFPSIKPKGKLKQPKWQARIHTDSWGPAPETGKSPGYTPNGTMLDEIIYMAPDLLVVFAAGNSGDNKDVAVDFANGQITSFPSAKNAITVGACFNGNQFIKVQNHGSREINLYDMYESQKDGGQVMGPENIPRFSSRGPIASSDCKRIKPDVVAPGVAVYSANSTVRITEQGYGLAPEPNQFCTFESGTSMAAPVVAGCAALLRQALARRGHQDPSAALIKALIVNGAVDLSTERGKLWKGNTTALGGCNELENEDIKPAPNNVQGWGRIDIAESVDNVVDAKLCGFEDIKLREGVEEGSEKDPRLKPDLNPADCHKFPVTIISPSDLKDKPAQKANIKATLAWTDLPGEDIQNWLTLSVIFDDGARSEKNRVVEEHSEDNALRVMADNNVQKVEVIDLEFTPDGRAIGLKVVVTAENLVANRAIGKKVNQGYAVCWKVWYSD